MKLKRFVTVLSIQAGAAATAALLSCHSLVFGAVCAVSTIGLLIDYAKMNEAQK